MYYCKIYYETFGGELKLSHEYSSIMFNLIIKHTKGYLHSQNIINIFNNLNDFSRIYKKEDKEKLKHILYLDPQTEEQFIKCEKLLAFS